VRSAKVSCSVPSQDRSPGHYGKYEHGQECECQRRCRNGISIAPHGYEESRNGSGTQGDDEGKQEAHAAFLPVSFTPSISFLLRDTAMRVCHRSTFRRCEPSHVIVSRARDLRQIYNVPITSWGAALVGGDGRRTLGSKEVWRV
jgi:hypothetical protein